MQSEFRVAALHLIVCGLNAGFIAFTIYIEHVLNCMITGSTFGVNVLLPAVARCHFLSCTGSSQSMWGEQRTPSSHCQATVYTSSSKNLLST